MLLRERSTAVAAIALVAVAAALLGPAGSIAKHRPKPRLSVTAWSNEPLGSAKTVEPGGKLTLCGDLATSTTKIYAYLKFRNMEKGRKLKIKWTLNGLLYAKAEQTWSLGAAGTAAAAMLRAPTQARFPSGLYRFSLSHGGRRLASSSITLNTDC